MAMPLWVKPNNFRTPDVLIAWDGKTDKALIFRRSWVFKRLSNSVLIAKMVIIHLLKASKTVGFSCE